MTTTTDSFYEVITAAINDIVMNGFDTQKRIDDWLVKIRIAAVASLTPERHVEEATSQAMRGIYQRMIVNRQILKYHPDISNFTLDMVRPKLRNELDRRILANAALIRLNREIAIQRTLQRFAGWSTSIPKGGSDVAEKVEVKKAIRKSLASLPFEERRVAIDQGHKFISSLNSILAVDQGALAGTWHSHWRRPGYNYREDHKDRDEKVYVVRGNWALAKGLMKVGLDGYSDQITQPGEEVYCSCSYAYIYNLTSIPDELLTEKGRRALEKAAIE